MTDSAGIARLLVAVADSFEERNAPASAGILRVAARRITELERQSRVGRVHTDQACRWCGAAVEQPSTGRRRVFCSDRCRRAAGRKGRNVKLEAV